MPVTARQARMYADRMDRLVHLVRADLTRESKQARRILEDAISAMGEAIAKEPLDGWRRNVFSLNLRREIDRVAAEGGAALFRGADEVTRRAIGWSDDVILGGFSELGIAGADLLAAAPQITQELLGVLTGYQSSLIQRVVGATKREITTHVRNSILGGLTPKEARDQIEATLQRAGATPLRFRSLAQRAEVIYRTESQRAFTLANRAKNGNLHEMFLEDGGIEKEWVHSGSIRPHVNHVPGAGVHGRSIPFPDRWKVGRVELLDPRDPGGIGTPRDVAAETIQCGCGTLTHLPETRKRQRRPTNPGIDVSEVKRDLDAILRVQSGTRRQRRRA